MNRNSIKSKAARASKWSLLTEISAKLMTPVSNMVLARLLLPEAFGMVATITMITSFADLFTDAGFQKYLIQHDFSDEKDYENSSNVAFWANLILSLVLWCLIFCFREDIARLVGNNGLGNALAVSALALPMTSFSSIQIARHKREFDFRTLFFVRIIAVIIPIVVTIPLAFYLKSFWSLIIGNLCINISNAIILTLRSNWKPSLYFSISKLKEMFSFSLWTLLEQLLGWANLNVGIFIVGLFINSYYLGVYKTSMASVNQVMEIAVSALSPVLLSSLSRYKEDREEFNEFFYSFEEKICMFIIPLGIGIFVYRELFTQILLGNQWSDAIGFIGLWALMRSLLIVFGKFSMEVFVSTGKPQYSVVTQVLELIVLLPVLLVTAKEGYHTLYIARSLVICWSIISKCVLLWGVAKISVIKIVRRSWYCFVSALLMGMSGVLFQQFYDGIYWKIASIFICIILYFMLVCINKEGRKNLIIMYNTVIRKKGADPVNKL